MMTAPRIRIGIATTAVGLLLGGAFVVVRRGDDSPVPDAPKAIAPAPRIVLSSDRLDFGDATDGVVVRQVLVRNGGASSAHVRVEAEGSGYSVDPTKLDLAAGEIGRVSVTAGPSSRGLGQLRLFADGSNAPLVVTLDGHAGLESLALARAEHSMNDAVERGMLGADAGGQQAGPTPLDARFAAPAVGPADAVLIARASEHASDAAGSAADIQDPVEVAPAPGSPRSYGPPPVGRSISDPSHEPRSSDPPHQGEQPEPIQRKPVKPSDPPSAGHDPLAPSGVPAFVVSDASTLTLLGSANQFYPQQVSVAGSGAGGSFRLASNIELPRVLLAFGQSMLFSQNGSAAGTFDPGSGEVSLSLPVQAVDANGYAAPFLLSLTTGTVVGRNNNGVLISVTGAPRSQDTGTLRLVGIGKIPTGFRNGAEEQFVTIQMQGSLTFPDATSSEVPSGSSGGGN